MLSKDKVLVSPGFGAGWSTWNIHARACASWLPIIQRIESGKPWPPISENHEKDPIREEPEVKSLIEHIAQEKHGGDTSKVHLCVLGLRECEVEFIGEGEQFKINEYDGAESVELRSNDEGWMS